jgi:DNA-binding CsgD family transcriptional regulator
MGAGLAAIFIQDPSALPPFPGEAFAKLYGLTKAELRVVLAMRQDATSPRMAASFGIGLHTVRTHLKNIFQKTGTSRQADLMTLMLRASGLTAVGAEDPSGSGTGAAEQR